MDIVNLHGSGLAGSVGDEQVDKTVEVRSDFRFRVLVHVLKVMVALKLIYSGRFYLYLGDNNSYQMFLLKRMEEKQVHVKPPMRNEMTRAIVPNPSVKTRWGDRNINGYVFVDSF